MTVTVDVRVVGAEKMYRLAEALQRAPKGVRKAAEKGLRRAVSPMTKDFRNGAAALLPRRGGLAEEVAAGMRFRTSVSLGDAPRLRIKASLPGHDLAGLDSGFDRHPVFGNRRNWVRQRIRANWWEDAGYVASDKAYNELNRALDEFAGELEAQA